MARNVARLTASAGIVAIGCSFLLATATSHANELSQNEAQRLYEARCAVCHGSRGRGDGPIARYLEPPPRDFSEGVYRLKSTPTGELPTDEDLLRTITRGIPGTAMIAWSGLSERERKGLVTLLKSFSPRFSKESPPVPIVISQKPAHALISVSRGREVYHLMKCDTCHGKTGRGDGVAADKLVDSQGRPTFAFDMTRGWKLKSGAEPEDIHRVVHTGLDGTPMPSYEQVLSPEDSWALAHYVRSLFLDQ